MKLAFASIEGKIRRDTTLSEVEIDQRSRSAKGIAPPANEQQAAQLRKYVEGAGATKMKEIREQLAETGESVISGCTKVVDLSFSKSD